MNKKEKEILEEMFSEVYKVEPSLHVTSEGEITSIKPSGIESIQSDRENDYGDARVSHQSIANFWNEYINRKVGNSDLSLDSTDVAVMLSLMKVSRLAYKRKHDSVLDFASYADFALQFEENK